MKVGKIAQLTTHDLAGVRVAASTVADALDGPTLLGRIVAIEKRLTDLALRVYELENRKAKGAK